MTSPGPDLDPHRLQELPREHPDWWEGGAGPVSVRELGRGESYRAHLVRRGEVERVVRVPHVPLSEFPQPPAEELAMLARVPAGLTARPLGVHETDGGDAPLAVVTTRVPGRMLPAAAWSDPERLRSLARSLAVLHVRGDRGGLPVPERIDPVAGAEDALAWWQEHEPETAEAVLAPVWPAVRAHLEPLRDAFGAADRVLLHGDVAAANLLVDDDGSVRFVDWEWSGVGDAARDLALIGGPVPLEPWYAGLTSEGTRRFAADYLAARAEEERAAGAPDSALDLESLLRRRAAHHLHELTFVAAHLHRVARAAGDSASREARRAAALRQGLQEYLAGP